MKTSIIVGELFNKWRNLIIELSSENFLSDDKKDEIFANMRKINNELALISLYIDKHIIAITGLQGAGKTTFIKRFYEMDDNYLPENLGRGECLPILVSEGDIEKPVGKVFRSLINNNGEIIIKDYNVSADDFKNIAMNPSHNDIWLELKAPFRHFYDENIYLALLPGFEEDEEERSQEMLDQILWLASVSILVVNKNQYAEKSNNDVMKNVYNIFKEVKPIIVLTRGDINIEQNDLILKQVIDDFKVEEDRVIVTGVNEFEIKSKSLIDVKKAIDKYGHSSNISEKKKKEMLQKICKKIKRQDKLLTKILKEEESDLINADMQIQQRKKIIFDFELICENIIKNIEKHIQFKLNEKVEIANKHFEKYIIENQGKLKCIKNKLPFGKTELEKKIEIKNAIIEAWNKANDQDCGKIISNIITEDVNRNAKYICENSLIDKSNNQNSIEGLIEINSETKFIDNINKYFSIDDKIWSLKHQDLEVLALIGVLLSRQALVSRPIIDIMKNLDNEKYTGDINVINKTVDDMKNFSDKITQLSNVNISILETIPIILGLDAIVDGDNDLVNNAVKALSGVGINILPVHLISILGGTFIFMYTLNSVQKVTDETNKWQLKIEELGRETISALPEFQSKAYSMILKNIFDDIVGALEKIHHIRSGKFDDRDKIDRLQYHLRILRNVNNQLNEAVINDGRIFI